jgi:hypothetical protein
LDWRCNKAISILSNFFNKSARDAEINSSNYSFFGVSYFGYNRMIMKNNERMKILSIPEKCTHDEALGYHLLNTFAEVFEKRKNMEIDDLQWQSWKSWMSLSIQHKSMIKIWEDAELQHYFDPLFHKFMNSEMFPLLINK